MTDASDARGQPAWSSEVLDFLTVRTQGMFRNITPKSAPDLAAHLLRTDWNALLVANILSSPAFESDIEQVTWLAPRELRRAQSSSRAQITHGLVRGRVLSRRTLVERLRRQDPTLWVADPRRHVFQTTSNGALAGFLDYILRVGSRLIELTDRGLPLMRGVAAVNRLLHTWPLAEVQPAPDWSAVSLPLDLMKVPTYALTWRWAMTFSAARRRRDSGNLSSAVAGWLAEESNDRLFELYALSRCVSALYASQAWHYMDISLSDLSVTARCDDGTVTILVDQTPRHQGRYNWLLDRYDGIDGRGRRPDLQLITTRPHATRTTFIEAKETAPNDVYGRDSVVKVLGYIKDYEELWSGESASYPRAVLLYSHTLRPKLPLAERLGDEILLSSPATFDEDLAGVIATHFALLTDH